MPRSPEELALTDRFDREYVRGQTETMRAIERAVCGCDYGGTSWTTRREAEQVRRLLKLRPGRHLLDVGAGSGWPAHYLARTSGCDVTLVDVPVEGIRIAAARAAAEPPEGFCRAAVGDGCALPMKARSFDAISHSDVLCCLEGKASVLLECRRVVRAHGAMVFTVISIAPGLSSDRAAVAAEFGPPYVESDCGYPEMLEKTRWRVIDCVDLTLEFAVSVRRFIDEWKNNEKKVTELIGGGEFNDIVARNTGKLQIIEDGGLCRHLYAAAPFSENTRHA